MPDNTAIIIRAQQFKRLFPVFLSIILVGGAGLVILSGKQISPFPLFMRIPGMDARPMLTVWLAIVGLWVAAWGAYTVITRLAPDADRYLLLASIFLSIIGFIVIFRLSPDMAAYTGKKAFAALAWRHLNMLVLSFFMMIITVFGLSQNVVAKLARRTYIYAFVAILLIIATGIFGNEINGRKLWLKLGPLNFQTVELVKILAVLFAAGYFAERRAFMTTQYAEAKIRFIHPHMIGPFIITALFCILPVILQGDLGPALLLSFLMLLMYGISGGSRVIIVLGLVSLAGAGSLAYYFEWPSIVKTRFDMWLDPFHYSEVLAKARWAISSGGFLGVGLGEGMSHRIPVVQSDFNFIVICEEMGVVGGISILGLYALIFWRGFMIAKRQQTIYHMLLAGGLTGLLGIQTLIILCGNIGLMPLTGITLPLISYGGSSLLVTFMIVGVLLKLSAIKMPGSIPI